MDPAGHGVFDFVERDPSRPGRRVPFTSGSIKATSFLEHLSDAGREVRAGNIPVAYPPFPVNGRMISGVAVPPGAEYVYPPEWREELNRRAPFPVNGLEWVNGENEPEALLEEARSLIEQRTSSFEVLLDGNWDAAACVYVEPDRDFNTPSELTCSLGIRITLNSHKPSSENRLETSTKCWTVAPSD